MVGIKFHAPPLNIKSIENDSQRVNDSIIEANSYLKNYIN